MRKIVFLLLAFVALTSKADERKMSYQVRQMAMGTSPAKKAIAKQGDRISTFVKLTADADQQVLEEHDCRILTRIGQIYIVEMPVSQLVALSDCNDVVRIETHVGAHRFLDKTAQHTNVLPAYEGTNLPQAFTGEGVLVGISDIGFDLTHPTFYNNDGTKYRIRRFLDQYTHNAESYGQSVPLGVEYTTEEAILQKKRSGDATSEMHGTHCLGIAAGSGYDKPYRGMAFEADLCAVASKTGDEVNYSANETAILKYIFDYADEVGQPCVITYSIGFDYLPGDDVLYHEALSEMLGPGHILVAAAGNENANTKYMHKKRGEATAGGALSGGWFSPAMTFFVFTSDDFKMTLNPLSGNATPVVIESNNMPEFPVTVGGHPLTITKQDTIYTCQITTDPYDFGSTVIGLIIEGEDVDAQVMADYYTELTNQTSADSRLHNVETGHTVMLPGTLPEVITVGAMDFSTTYSSTYGDIAQFSSQGPTIDYHIKPDVVTPGVSVVSALNSFYTGVSSGTYTSTFNGKRYGWIAESGTSMATPAAAGVVALWLQARPELTPADVLDVIAHTSQHPKDNMDYPNNTFGHGHIDAYQGLLYILGAETAISELSSHQPQQATFRLEGRRLYVSYMETLPPSTELTVYTLDGKPVATQRGSNVIDLSPLPAGVYAVQLNTGKKETTGSTLIRL